MEQDLLQVQPNSHAHAHAPAQPSAGAADASSTGWVWWASLKTCTPAASVCIWVANLRSNFQPQHKRHLFSYLCPQAFHPAVPPNAPSLLWFCIICTQKSSQKKLTRSHPKETTEVWRLVMWFCFSSLCASLSEPFVMSCTNSFFAHNISKVTPEAKTEARRSAGWSDQRAWMKTYLLTREDKGTIEQPMKGIVPPLSSPLLSLSILGLAWHALLTTLPFHAKHGCAFCSASRGYSSVQLTVMCSKHLWKGPGLPSLHAWTCQPSVLPSYLGLASPPPVPNVISCFQALVAALILSSNLPLRYSLSLLSQLNFAHS